jgi:hypothetical protein
MNKRTKWWYAWRAIAGLVIGMIGHEAYALDFNIVTAGERGTYIQIGKDLATIIAKPAGIDLGVLPSNGSVENVKRLRYDPGIKLCCSGVARRIRTRMIVGRRAKTMNRIPLAFVVTLAACASNR